IDTIVVCTLTAITILCVGDITYGVDNANLTFLSLGNVYGRNIIFIFCPLVCFFAFSSTIGWGLYGTKFIVFLLGQNARKPFLFIFIFAMIPAAVFRTDAVWVVAEILNGIMALPNITALLLLTNEVADITYSYKRKLQGK
ncbi:MAG: alanine:cation symporter family protein, partial [Clostridia bacterium]|nr:alanine:cation symporter family protein [Clostridia bacterium]